MRKYSCFFLLLILSMQARTQEHGLLDSVIGIMQKRSIYRKNVNWEQLKPIIYSKINTKKEDPVFAIAPAVRFIFDTLKDDHSIFVYKNIPVKSNPGKYLQRADSITRLKAAAATLKTQYLGNDIGYIQIPGGNTKTKKETEERATVIRNALCSLNPANLKGLIIDLRLNTGGSIPPVFTGIAPLLGEGIISYQVYADGRKLPLNISEGNFAFDNFKTTNIPNSTDCSNARLKIAVLIGPATSSAGESIAIAFTGRDHVKLFGETTGGFVTGNATINLRSDLILIVAGIYPMNLKGLIFKEYVQPDIWIEGGDNYDFPERDKKIQAALQWLNQAGKN